MNTLHLKYAVEVSKTGSITKAAKRLFVNQPYLSKMIHEFEETMGFEIFKRTSKGIIPTKRGSEFLDHARNILIQVEKLENLLRESPRSYLNVTAPRASYISFAFTDFIAGNLSLGKKMDIDYREASSIQAIENVTDGISDIGVVRCKEKDERFFMDLLQERKLRANLIGQFEYMVVMSEKHDLANRDVISYPDLGDYIEITCKDADSPSGGFERRGRDNGTISIHERASQYEILKRVPSAYMWASPAPRGALEAFSLVQRRSDMPDNRVKDFLICREDYKLAEEDKSFIEKIRDRRPPIKSSTT